MSRAALFFRYWAPVLVCMALVFSASTDVGASWRSSRIIAPFLRWLVPGIPERTVRRVVFAVRKAAHVTEYAVLSVLLWRAWRKPVKGDTRPWDWRPAGLALCCAAAYAASDELHQAFVPSREARWGDVLYDTAGAALGLLVLWLIGRRRNRW